MSDYEEEYVLECMHVNHMTQLQGEQIVIQCLDCADYKVFPIWELKADNTYPWHEAPE